MSQHEPSKDPDSAPRLALPALYGRWDGVRRPGARLRRKHRDTTRRSWRWLTWAWLIAVYTVAALGVLLLAATLVPLTLPADRYPGPTRILSGDGELLAMLYDRYRRPVTLYQVPSSTVHAVLAAEDRRFFSHHGLDGRGILRAAWANLRAGRVVQGGSTITQQLVRLDLLDERRTFRRKLREVVLALRVERAHSKREILERYLNAVYFGNGAYGIAAAAEAYFGKPVNRLTTAESALLAGLIRAPGGGDPRYHFATAVQRQRSVLAAMRTLHWLSAAQYRQALAQPLRLHRRARPSWRAPYVVEAVRRELLTEYDRDVIYHGGLTIVTTVDAGMQQAAERAMRNALAAGAAQQVGNGALVALDPHTGAIRALVGGAAFRRSQFNRALQAHRQPGSAFKAFVYLAALEHGRLMNDTELDAPITVGDWSPHNYSDRYNGPVLLETALARSLNSVAIRLAQQVSPYAVVAAARAAGITSPLTPTLPLALGVSEVTPLEMARAFATFANGGKAIEPALIREIRRGDAVLFRLAPVAQQRITPKTAFLLTQGLQAVIATGTGRRAVIGRPAAGKTGTANDFRDAWFIGYTPDLCAAVWMGNDDHRPMAGVSGGSLPAQTWAAFMRAALRGVPPSDFPVPPGLVRVMLCRDTGLCATPGCPSMLRYLPADRVPTECLLHLSEPSSPEISPMPDIFPGADDLPDTTELPAILPPTPSTRTVEPAPTTVPAPAPTLAPPVAPIVPSYPKATASKRPAHETTPGPFTSPDSPPDDLTQPTPDDQIVAPPPVRPTPPPDIQQTMPWPRTLLQWLQSLLQWGK